MEENILKKIQNIDEIKSDYEMNKLLKSYFQYIDCKKKSMIKEKENLLKENAKLNKDIENINYEIKVLENDKSNIINNSKIKIEKTLNLIEKLQKENELEIKKKDNEFELNIKKLENEKNKRIEEIYLYFMEETSKINRENNKKDFSKKYQKLEYEKIKDSMYLNFIKLKKELDCEIYNINLRKSKYKSQQKIKIKALNNSKNIELKKLNNEKQLFLKEIEYEKQILYLNSYNNK